MDAFVGEGFTLPYPSPGPFRVVPDGVKTPILSQNQHLENHEKHQFRMRHPSKMEVPELLQGGYVETHLSLKPVFSLEASLKNRNRIYTFFS